MLKAGQESLPFTNTRLLLAEEAGNEDSYFLGSGVVVRLFSSPTSHPAVRQTLQGLHSRCGKVLAHTAPASAVVCRLGAGHGRPAGAGIGEVPGLTRWLPCLQAGEPWSTRGSGAGEQAR
jgi:hypothetical protein